LDGCTEYRWPLLFCPGSSFRSRISIGDGTGNGPMISLRPQLITAHHFVSSLSDPAREDSPCSRYLRPARDVDTTCSVRRNVHESLATRVRERRAPNLLRGCVGRSHVDHTEGRKATIHNRSVEPHPARGLMMGSTSPDSMALTWRGRSVSDEPGRAYKRPRSGAAPDWRPPTATMPDGSPSPGRRPGASPRALR
jgi:hypothetical protein